MVDKKFSLSIRRSEGAYNSLIIYLRLLSGNESFLRKSESGRIHTKPYTAINCGNQKMWRTNFSRRNVSFNLYRTFLALAQLYLLFFIFGVFSLKYWDLSEWTVAQMRIYTLYFDPAILRPVYSDRVGLKLMLMRVSRAHVVATSHLPWYTWRHMLCPTVARTCCSMFTFKHLSWHMSREKFGGNGNEN